MAHLGEVAANHDRLRAAGVSVVTITQAGPEQLQRFLSRRTLPFPLVSDPGRAAYTAFGLGRTSWLSFFRPKVLWGFVRLMARGHRVRAPYRGEDARQLGGDFLLDRGRRVLFAFRSDDPTKRPGIDDILNHRP